MSRLAAIVRAGNEKEEPWFHCVIDHIWYALIIRADVSFRRIIQGGGHARKEHEKEVMPCWSHKEHGDETP